MSQPPKDVEIKARVSSRTKQTIEGIAHSRGESVSVIVREAIKDYLQRLDLPQSVDSDPTTGKFLVIDRQLSRKKRKEKRNHFRDVREVSLFVFDTIPAGWPDYRRAIKPKRTVMVPKGMYSSSAFGLDVIGDSMNAARGKLGPIFPGETVVLVPFTSADEAANRIVAAIIDGHTTLKRLVCPKRGDCYLRPESTNPVFAGKMHPLHDLEIQGVVVGKLP